MDDFQPRSGRFSIPATRGEGQRRQYRNFETDKKVLRLLVALNRILGKTVVVITHNAAIAQVVDRVIHLRSGEISELVENATPVAPEEVVW